jgi:hypothetical protein
MDKLNLGNVQIPINAATKTFAILAKRGAGKSYTGAAKIFKFLAENPHKKFTRAQLGLAVGLNSGSGSFATYMATLKRNKLVLEQNRECWINPDL